MSKKRSPKIPTNNGKAKMVNACKPFVEQRNIHSRLKAAGINACRVNSPPGASIAFRVENASASPTRRNRIPRL